MAGAVGERSIIAGRGALKNGIIRGTAPRMLALLTSLLAPGTALPERLTEIIPASHMSQKQHVLMATCGVEGRSYHAVKISDLM